MAEDGGGGRELTTNLSLVLVSANPIVDAVMRSVVMGDFQSPKGARVEVKAEDMVRRRRAGKKRLRADRDMGVRT